MRKNGRPLPPSPLLCAPCSTFAVPASSAWLPRPAALARQLVCLCRGPAAVPAAVPVVAAVPAAAVVSSAGAASVGHGLRLRAASSCRGAAAAAAAAAAASTAAEARFVGTAPVPVHGAAECVPVIRG